MANLEIAAPQDQRYACRDCPARCCRVPWQIRFSEADAARYVAEPWINERLSPAALAIMASGVLPMREHERRLQCAFLDEDNLCSMQKKFGHSYLPNSCQSFPFGFVTDKDNSVIAQLSHLCPSIRDNYGEPVLPQLKDKLRQVGQPERTSSAMSTTSRVFLTKGQYGKVAAQWKQSLGKGGTPLQVLARLYDQTRAFELALEADGEKAKDSAVAKAIASAFASGEVEPLEPLPKPSFHARACYSYLLGNLCYPARVRQPHATGDAPSFGGLRAALNKWAWMRQRGTVDLLFVDGEVSLQAVRKVAPCLSDGDGDLGTFVQSFLVMVLERRHLFARPRFLLDVLVDLSIAAVVVARFARCRASAAGLAAVRREDVAEGMSVAELVLLSHLNLAEQGKTLANVRQLMLADRKAFRALLASEL